MEHPWLGLGYGASASDYGALLIFLSLGLVISVLFLVLSYVRGTFRPSEEKASPYECGFDAMASTDKPFPLPFYLVAILFIVFDIEVSLLFPWALTLHDVGWQGFQAAMAFLSILAVGFVYEWRAGAMEWD